MLLHRCLHLFDFSSHTCFVNVVCRICWITLCKFNAAVVCNEGIFWLFAKILIQDLVNLLFSGSFCIFQWCDRSILLFLKLFVMTDQLSSILHRFDFLSESFWKIGSIIRLLPYGTLNKGSIRRSCGRLSCLDWWFIVKHRQEMSSASKAVITFKIAARKSVSLLAVLLFYL